MTSIQGPDVAQVSYKPVVIIEDSKKHEDGVSMKIAGSNGATEFTPDEIVQIAQYIGEFLQAKGLGSEVSNILRHGSGLLTSDTSTH